MIKLDIEGTTKGGKMFENTNFEKPVEEIIVDIIEKDGTVPALCLSVDAEPFKLNAGDLKDTLKDQLITATVEKVNTLLLAKALGISLLDWKRRYREERDDELYQIRVPVDKHHSMPGTILFWLWRGFINK